MKNTLIWDERAKGKVNISRETVEKPIRNLAVIPDGVDFGGILDFLEQTALS